MVVGDPAPGKRVRQVAPDYVGTDVHHALYLPTDWKPDGKYPGLRRTGGPARPLIHRRLTRPAW